MTNADFDEHAGLGCDWSIWKDDVSADSDRVCSPVSSGPVLVATRRVKSHKRMLRTAGHRGGEADITAPLTRADIGCRVRRSASNTKNTEKFRS
jgi:hypothetical protein